MTSYNFTTGSSGQKISLMSSASLIVIYIALVGTFKWAVYLKVEYNRINTKIT